MKKLILIILALFSLPCVFADLDDSELACYLDTAFPNQYVDGVVVLGRFKYEYGNYGQHFKSMLTSLVRGLDDDVVQALNLSAQSMFASSPLFGSSTPNKNWSVVIDVNTQSVLQVFKAGNISYSGSLNEEGQKVYQASSESNASMWSYSSMTGQSLGFMVPKTDPETGITEEVMEYYRVAAAVNRSPIMIDVNFDNKPDTNRNIWLPHAPQFFAERVAKFDMSGDGLPELAEWLGPNDALLVLPEADGSVKSALNLFGTAGGYADGYQKMATVLDLDGNGWAEQDELNGLCVWKDLNGNAQADKGEMKSVQELGIEKISVLHKNFQSVCIIKGKEVKTWDWWPACYELIKEKR